MMRADVRAFLQELQELQARLVALERRWGPDDAEVNGIRADFDRHVARALAMLEIGNDAGMVN